MIYESDRKNDRLDARMLARLGRADVELLSPVEHRSADTQADLAVIRGRDALVTARTQLINSCRGMVKAMGGAPAEVHDRCVRREDEGLCAARAAGRASTAAGKRARPEPAD